MDKNKYINNIEEIKNIDDMQEYIEKLVKDFMNSDEGIKQINNEIEKVSNEIEIARERIDEFIKNRPVFTGSGK
jgi:peptidoglycan hydrolase CwlO-like protein